MKHPNKNTKEDLKYLQELPLEKKIELSKLRIQEWYEHYDGKVAVSFSGGKDSTVLLHLVRSVYPDVPAVFCDTGLEYPEIRQFAMAQDNVTVLKPKMDFRSVIAKYGYPAVSKEVSERVWMLKHYNLSEHVRRKFIDGIMPDGSKTSFRIPFKWQKLFLQQTPDFEICSRCCDVMKKQPFKKYIKETERYCFLGVLAEESLLRHQAFLKNGCNAYDSKIPTSRPLMFWTEQDVLSYIVKNHLKISSVYGDVVCENGIYRITGVQRTGCVFCMFGVHKEKHPNRFERLKQTHPKLYAYCMKPWEEGGLGLNKVLDYIGVKY